MGSKPVSIKSRPSKVPDDFFVHRSSPRIAGSLSVLLFVNAVAAHREIANQRFREIPGVNRYHDNHEHRQRQQIDRCQNQTNKPRAPAASGPFGRAPRTRFRGSRLARKVAISKGEQGGRDPCDCQEEDDRSQRDDRHIPHAGILATGRRALIQNSGRAGVCRLPRSRYQAVGPSAIGCSHAFRSPF